MGLIDTGADITALSQAKWPSQWSLAKVPQAFSGIGGSSHSYQSQHLILIKGPDRQLASVKPFVLPVPMVLEGRNVLSQEGFRIQYDF